MAEFEKVSSEGGWPDIRCRVEKIRERRLALENRKAELDFMQEKLVEEARKLQEEKDGVFEEIKLVRDLMAELMAREGDGGQGYEELHKEIMGYISPQKDKSSEDENPLMSFFKKKKVGDPQNNKRKIKTLLHIMLETTEKEGKIKVKDLARKLKADERVVEEWAMVMANRRIVKLGYSMRGEAVLERMPKHK